MDENIIIEKILSKYNETAGLKILKQVLGSDRINSKRLRTHINAIKKDKDTLEHLKTIPKIEQRTPEWYQTRHNMITASDMAQALDKGKFGTQKDFFKKKCSTSATNDTSLTSTNPALTWGVIYEPIATKIYEKRLEIKVHEFGLLKHENVHFFGASPDGISENGIMLEIKCPYKRKIDGSIPEQYYYQIQGQLDVCNLEKCDYVECKFIEYDTFDNFVDDWTKDELTLNNAYNEKGIVIEVVNKDDENNTVDYIYSEIYISKEKLQKWLKTTTDKLRQNNLEYYMHYWKLDQYHVKRIIRNKKFFDTEINKLKVVWDDVIKFREDTTMLNNFLNLKKKKTTNNNTCMIIDIT